MGTSNLTATQARTLLSYNPETGQLFWNVQRGSARPGKEAGGISRLGNRLYRRVGVCGGYYLAHRLAFLIMIGSWPMAEVDHLDGDSLNNRWANLRDVPKAVNLRNAKVAKNNTSGVSGVHPAGEKWVAQIRVGERTLHLGTFPTVDEAALSRRAAEVRYGYRMPAHVGGA